MHVYTLAAIAIWAICCPLSYCYNLSLFGAQKVTKLLNEKIRSIQVY